MKSQPQNHELRINPENFHPCVTHYHTPLSNLDIDFGKIARYRLWAPPKMISA